MVPREYFNLDDFHSQMTEVGVKWHTVLLDLTTLGLGNSTLFLICKPYSYVLELDYLLECGNRPCTNTSPVDQGLFYSSIKPISIEIRTTRENLKK
jgi:hypothetical protein